MEAQDIESTEFFIAMRGYDRNEVRGFLKGVASEQGQLLARIEALEAATPAPSDPIDDLGRHVNAIVGSAQVMLADAEVRAEAVRHESQERARIVADAAAANLAAAADQLERARHEADALVAEALERLRSPTGALVQDAAFFQADATVALEGKLRRLDDALDGVQAILSGLAAGSRRSGRLCS